MRVITGSARGRRLITPGGMDVRPTLDKVKEGLFSSIQFEIEGRTVLDLFAGSGQLGIEALSRGAEYCVFVDSAKASLQAVQANISACGFSDRAKCIASDSLSYLSVCRDSFGIAFLDPPYHKQLIDRCLPLVAAHMTTGGIIICESDIDEILPEEAEEFKIYRVNKYSKTKITVYRRI